MIHPIFTYVLTTAKKNSSAGAAAKLWPLSTFTLLPAVFLQCCYIHVAINQCCLLWHFLSALCLCMSNFPTCRLTICPHFNIKRVEKFQQKLRSTLFENHPQYPLGISHLWHFPPIFVLLKSSCIQICWRCWMRLFLWLSNTVEMATVKWTPTLMCLLILITFGHASEAAVTVKGWGCTHTLQNVILPFFFYCISSSSSSDDTMKYRPF